MNRKRMKRNNSKKNNNKMNNDEKISLKLPRDTRQLLNDNIENIGLKLNKYIKFVEKKGKEEVQKRTNNGMFRLSSAQKKLLDQITIRNRKMIIELQQAGYEIKTALFKPLWRMTIGLGVPSVRETSMLFHHIYGIPYIPASMIKGVVRNYIITEKFRGGDQKAEEAALQDEGFCDIFGCPKNSVYKESRQGKIIFFDAFPIDPVNIEWDIMNVHYQKYYNGNEYPTDSQNPNPVFFLTIKDTQFYFVIGIKRENEKIKSGVFAGEKILDLTFDYLKETLENYGLGAKTAVGYGFMKEENLENFL
ncbi:type III-B CRISPR module RAMP protein Cmr6 [Caloranaerobacter azorensis]|uniref:type III-B CRISPR module RAMP protein Cmr6 n=1 Tax=Caloranaerobacter azorensis TaxID=116090 RepID=UPI0018CF608F|nr:type III-B CRISPR module RAMP protein Cmr6 [Caloranaerobacter azorensis]